MHNKSSSVMTSGNATRWARARVIVPLVSVILGVALPVREQAFALRLYSIDKTVPTDAKLVKIDTDTGAVFPLGPIGLDFQNQDADLVFWNQSIYVLMTNREVDSKLARLDRYTGAVLWIVPVTYQGNPVRLAEGLAATHDGLVIALRTAAATNSSYSNALGLVDTLGVVTNVLDFTAMDTRADVDALGSGAGDRLFWCDATSSAISDVRLFDVSLQPPSMSLIAQSQPFRAINDVVLFAGSLWAVDSEADELLRMNPTTGAILGSTGFDTQMNLVGLAADLNPSGFVSTTYASVVDPVTLAFSPSGELFVGRDNTGSGGGTGDAVRIHRIGAGGSPVEEYGGQPVSDPDAVIVDATGLCAAAGSILVGGYYNYPPERGFIVAIRPDQTLLTVVSASEQFTNPLDFTVDRTGRMLFADYASNRVLALTAGCQVTTLFTLPATPYGIAVDDSNHIYTSTQDGIIRIHDAQGTELESSFAVGLRGALEFGPGGTWGRDLYVLTNPDGNLFRVAMTGDVTHLTSGLDGALDLAFGIDNALYVSDFNRDRIVRITPSSTTSTGHLPSQGSYLYAFPNPTRAGTSLRFRLGVAARVQLAVYSVSGRRIRTLVDQRQPAGESHIHWNGFDDQGQRVSSGIYFVRLETTGQRIVKTVSVIR